VTDIRGRLHIDRGEGQWVLSGSIDETSALAELLARATANQLALDLAGVQFINSLGVRDWIRMQTDATRQGIAIELRRVSEPIVHQLNMIVATRGTARVTSFFAPYACDACGREDSLLVDAVTHATSLTKLVPPTQTCPECGAVMAFNDFPERYFSFLVPDSAQPG
jgi:anti-anti-sigma regulatory factor